MRRNFPAITKTYGEKHRPLVLQSTWMHNPISVKRVFGLLMDTKSKSIVTFSYQKLWTGIDQYLTWSDGNDCQN